MSKELVKNKLQDLVKELQILNYIDNSIPKEAIEDAIKYEKGEIKYSTDEYRNKMHAYTLNVLEEILEGKWDGKEISIKICELFNTLDNIGWDIAEAKTNLDILESKIKEKNEKAIKDIDNLKRELKRDGLYSNKIEEFLENYMRYYNK